MTPNDIPSFLYYLQTTAHDRTGDFPHSFRYMKLADDYGTPDHLPPNLISVKASASKR